MRHLYFCVYERGSEKAGNSAESNAKERIFLRIMELFVSLADSTVIKIIIALFSVAKGMEVRTCKRGRLLMNDDSLRTNRTCILLNISEKPLIILQLNV